MKYERLCSTPNSDSYLQAEEMMLENIRQQNGHDYRRNANFGIATIAKAVVTASLTALLLWTLLVGLAHHPRLYVGYLPPRALSCSCGGTTVADAIAQGCKFTPLAIAWLPPHCIDQEIADEFDNAGPTGGWPYWADSNGTIPITVEDVGKIADVDGGVFYTTQEWHVAHCAYTWRKQFRAPATGVTVEKRSSGLAHIAHCEKIMMIRQPLDAIWTRAGIALDADTEV